MPKRVSPKYYETPPLFYGEGTEQFEDEDTPTRDEFGRFTFAPTRVKDPSATIYPPRPRSHRVSYSSRDRTLRIQFRNGRVYGYYDVPGNVWRDLKGVASTGRFINRRLDPFFEYGEEWPADV
jgi:hypothetical protein